MGNVDPEQKFTGGVSIEFIDNHGMERGEAHIALENQPLSVFVETAMIEKGMQGSFQIIKFQSEICKIIVMLEKSL
ncbi:MAG: hypothetical protein GF365_02385 [Candidatus Buchananbacteria bacterium]|nr:hypothetical protein [Candidatus Buchananbacteria bacterium]